MQAEQSLKNVICCNKHTKPFVNLVAELKFHWATLEEAKQPVPEIQKVDKLCNALMGVTHMGIVVTITSARQMHPTDTDSVANLIAMEITCAFPRTSADARQGVSATKTSPTNHDQNELHPPECKDWHTADPQHHCNGGVNVSVALDPNKPQISREV